MPLVDVWLLPGEGAPSAGPAEGLRDSGAVHPHRRAERRASRHWQQRLWEYYAQALRGSGDVGLSLSVTHSAGCLVIAVCGKGRVGVDVERRRPVGQFEALCRRFLSPQEAEEILALHRCHRLEAFFRVWTRKEAYLKALGCPVGVPAGLRQFSVSVDAQSPTILHTSLEPHGRSSFSLVDLDLPSGYTGALAVEARGARILTYGPDALGESVS